MEKNPLNRIAEALEAHNTLLREWIVLNREAIQQNLAMCESMAQLSGKLEEANAKVEETLNKL